MLEAEQRALEALKARGAAPPEAAPADARDAAPPDADVRTETAVKRLKELEPSIRAVRRGLPKPKRLRAFWMMCRAFWEAFGRLCQYPSQARPPSHTLFKLIIKNINTLQALKTPLD